MRRLCACSALSLAVVVSASRQFFATPAGLPRAPAQAAQPTAQGFAKLRPGPAAARFPWAVTSMRRSAAPAAMLPSLNPDAAASNLAAIAGILALTAATLRSPTVRRPRHSAANAARVAHEALRQGPTLRHSGRRFAKQQILVPAAASTQAGSVERQRTLPVEQPQALKIMAEFLDKSDLKKVDVAIGRKMCFALVAVPSPAWANERDGWLGWTVDATEFAIKGIHDVLGSGSYGYAILLFTLMIKALTFPLNYQQIESSSKMQALQPKVKTLQEKYRNDPATMNQKLGELYVGANVNPLAALLPTFVQLPILISLYKGLNYLSEEDALEEPFLWLPNLEGPTFGNRGMDWLLKFEDWHGGVPPLGWDDTLRFLSLPAILILTQKVSIELQKPPDAMENLYVFSDSKLESIF